MDLDWLWYEKRITDLFRRLKHADVEHNVRERGRESGVDRQIDIRVRLPLRVVIQEGFSFEIPVTIIVDCKARNRSIDVKAIEEIGGLRDDVSAQLAVVVTPMGVTKAAESRCKSLGVYPIVVTADLLALMQPFPNPGLTTCQICSYDPNDDDHGPPMVFWQSDRTGRCNWCQSLHVLCPECGIVVPISESEYNQALRCPMECDSHFVVEYPANDAFEEGLLVVNALDSHLLLAAYSKTTKRLTRREVDKLVRQTRWQHWGESRPTTGLTEGGSMEERDDEMLYLTPNGEDLAKMLQIADYPMHY